MIYSSVVGYVAEGDAVESVDALIKEISDHIGRGWMVLARSLRFTETDIDSIEYANERDLKEQIHQFFSRWKQRVGQEATRDMLYAALYDGELNELLKKLDKTDVKNSTSELLVLNNTLNCRKSLGFTHIPNMVYCAFPCGNLWKLPVESTFDLGKS